MTAPLNLDFYQRVFHKVAYEGGLGEYVHSYECEDTFEGDPELQELFIAAKKSLLAFETLLEDRITSLGGDLDDWKWDGR